MIIILLICASAIAVVQSLNKDHTHYFPVRRKTDYKVNISITDDDIEMVVPDNLSLYHFAGNKFSKRFRKKPLRKSRTNILDEKHDDSNVIFCQNNISLSSPNVTISTPSENKSQATDFEENVLCTACETSDQIRQIMQRWLFVYIVLAVPIWCTIGRCCCCLCCKRFRAQDTIKEAKLYSTWNAPGVLRNKTGDMFYEPSEAEKEAHEALEHLIRTL